MRNRPRLPPHTPRVVAAVRATSAALKAPCSKTNRDNGSASSIKPTVAGNDKQIDQSQTGRKVLGQGRAVSTCGVPAELRKDHRRGGHAQQADRQLIKPFGIVKRRRGPGTQGIGHRRPAARQ